VHLCCHEYCYIDKGFLETSRLLQTHENSGGFWRLSDWRWSKFHRYENPRRCRSK